MEYVEHKAVWFPTPSRVAGLRLMPPTIGQIRLLEAVSSPFLVGGEAVPLDVAIALHILRTPWRFCRWQLCHTGLFAALAHLLLLRRAVRAESAAAAISAFIDASLWEPERYIQDGSTAPAFRPATGYAVRLALRTARLPLASLCHTGSGSVFSFLISAFSFQLSAFSSWRCAWDVPVPAAIAYCIAQAESTGSEYQDREERDQIRAAERTAKEAPRHV
jgi:hypothetical protein